MPTISVIVPVYNTEEYLCRCVDSILAQTFTDFELLLVDDGSTDASGAICDEYAEKDSRVRVFHQENKGVSAARNAGLQEAAGQYVMFCDGDDYVAGEWAETLLSEAELNPGAMIVCDVAREEQDLSNDAFSVLDVAVIRVSYLELYKKGVSAYSFNKIFLMETVRESGLLFDESVMVSEDVDFTTRYCKACKDIVYIDKKLYFYETNASGAMAMYRPNGFALHLLPFRNRLTLIEENDLPEYCGIWYYQFYYLFDVVFDDRNRDMSFLEKMRYNQTMLCSEEFQFCLSHASLKNENPVFVFFMKHKNYYLLWLVQKLYRIKNLIGGNSK